jgi:hypothetical protein
MIGRLSATRGPVLKMTRRDKAVQAAGRMLHRYPAGYPTRAREDVDPREVVEIGTIDSKTYRIDFSARLTT